MSDRLSAYIKNRLLACLGRQGRHFVLERCPAGVHTEIYFLKIGAEPGLVLKLYAKRQRFRQAVAHLRYLSGLGLPVPKIISADEDNRFFSRRGMHVLAEERIPGESLERLPRSPEIITKVAELYAGMHGHVRDTWGDIDCGRTAGLYEYLEKKIRERLAGWSRSEELAPALQGKILEKFAAGASAINRIRSFSLSHTDPNRNNILLRESDRKLFLLDTGSIRYLPRAMDYFMLQAYFCFDNPAHAELFEKIYFSSLSKPELAAFNETRDYFRLYVIILFIHDLTTRFAALDRSSPYYQEFAGLIPLAKNALMEMIETHAEA